MAWKGPDLSIAQTGYANGVRNLSFRTPYLFMKSLLNPPVESVPLSGWLPA
jgi:hypothetical protein